MKHPWSDRQRAAISVREPWCSLLLLESPGRKDVENRWSQTVHRGRLYLHSSKTVRKAEYRETMRQLHQAIEVDQFFPGLTWADVEHLEDPAQLEHLGCFRGVVNLTGISRDGSSPWATEDEQWKWHVETPYRIVEPIPFIGKQAAPWRFPWTVLQDSQFVRVGDSGKT